MLDGLFSSAWRAQYVKLTQNEAFSVGFGFVNLSAHGLKFQLGNFAMGMALPVNHRRNVLACESPL